MAHLSRGFVGTRQVADKNTLHASLCPASPGRRFRRTPVPCAHAPRVQPENKATPKAVSELRAVAVVIVLAQAVAASEAQAWDHSWKPRRHHKRMTERSIDVKQFFQEAGVKDRLETGTQQVQQQAGNAVSEAQQLAQDVKQSLQKVLAPRQREMHMGEAARPTAPSYSGQRGATAGPLGWLAVAAAAAGLVWLFFGKLISGAMSQWGRGGKKGGKWVSDRSLGGRMVWMADEPDTKSSSARSQSLRWDDTPSSSSAVLPHDETDPASVSGRHTPTGPKAPQQQKGPPSWWDPPPSVHVDQRYKDQTSSQARTILRQMEDGKLLSGRDYPTSALVSLRQTCADSGAVVKAQTPSGGDAIFRAGVEAAVSAAMEPGQGASLGGASPPRFVSGLAHDLGLADEKAGSMAVAVVAARLRSLLKDAAAASRKGDEIEELDQLVRVVGLLDKFPLPPSSPQADMIAAAVQQRATLQERQALFFTYGGMEPNTASVMAEMLGFNPDLVMPQLQIELDAVQQHQADSS
ncbi:hypothetical protein ABBQ38_010187 [Trebouxia sp. C0009 RCD-2024]